jgi:hypothetical protein
VIIDKPVSIYTHADRSEQERQDAGGMTPFPERMIVAFGGAPTNDHAPPDEGIMLCQSKSDVKGPPRGDGLSKYFDEKGLRILAVRNLGRRFK